MFKQTRSAVSVIVLAAFICTSIKAPVYAQVTPMSLMPKPGTMISLTSAFVPVLVKGLRVHPENPLLFDFILDTGNSGLKITSPQFKGESEKLIKYFLASLTVKEDDLWVNLSPYEKDRIIPDPLGQTGLGRDMLAQDYILKQLTASLIYPEKQLGQEFWNRVYAKARQEFGTSQVAVNTFNKVWIIADKARILERNNVGYVVGSHLKVMLEEDYLSLLKHECRGRPCVGPQDGRTQGSPLRNGISTLGSQIVRQIIIPELDKEVNQGKNFAPLRQMFYSMILASWYKLALKDALLNQVYSNKGKTGGVLSEDPAAKEKIFQQYLQAYKKGVFNYIKEDMDAASKQLMPRKYFSGGLRLIADPARLVQREQNLGPGDDAQVVGDMAMETVGMSKSVNPDKAMTAQGLVELQSALAAETRHYPLTWSVEARYNGKSLSTEKWPSRVDLTSRIMMALEEIVGENTSKKFIYDVDRYDESVQINITDAAMGTVPVGVGVTKLLKNAPIEFNFVPGPWGVELEASVSGHQRFSRAYLSVNNNDQLTISRSLLQPAEAIIVKPGENYIISINKKNAVEIIWDGKKVAIKNVCPSADDVFVTRNAFLPDIRFAERKVIISDGERTDEVSLNQDFWGNSGKVLQLAETRIFLLPDGMIPGDRRVVVMAESINGSNKVKELSVAVAGAAVSTGEKDSAMVSRDQLAETITSDMASLGLDLKYSIRNIQVWFANDPQAANMLSIKAWDNGFPESVDALMSIIKRHEQQVGRKAETIWLNFTFSGYSKAGASGGNHDMVRLAYNISDAAMTFAQIYKILALPLRLPHDGVDNNFPGGLKEIALRFGGSIRFEDAKIILELPWKTTRPKSDGSAYPSLFDYSPASFERNEWPGQVAQEGVEVLKKMVENGPMGKYYEVQTSLGPGTSSGPGGGFDTVDISFTRKPANGRTLTRQDKVMRLATKIVNAADKKKVDAAMIVNEVWSYIYRFGVEKGDENWIYYAFPFLASYEYQKGMMALDVLNKKSEGIVLSVRDRVEISMSEARSRISPNSALHKIEVKGGGPSIYVLNEGYGATETTDYASQEKRPPGGIDLNAKNMSMDVSGQGIDMKFDPAMVAEFRRGDFSGLIADIIRIVPIKSVLPMMGLETSPA